MKTIEPFDNTPTIMHVNQLTALSSSSLAFGFTPGKLGDIPTLRVNITLMNLNNKIATYDSAFKIKGEGLILEEHLYTCCKQAISAMKLFLRFDKVGRSIPQELIQCPEKEVFEDDLIETAKVLNALDGKRNFPSS